MRSLVSAIAIVPIVLPSASAPSHFAFISSEPPRTTASVASAAENRNGPGMAAKPCSSSSTAMSSMPNPAPPNFSGTIRPVHPSFAISRHSSGKVPSSLAIARRTAGVGHSAASSSRALVFSCCCSSLSPKSILLPRLGHLEAALGDDVLLNVRGPTADHETQRKHPLIGPVPFVEHALLVSSEHRIVAHRFHGCGRQIVVQFGADQLVDHGFDSRLATTNLVGELTHRVQAHRLDPDLEVGQPLAKDRIFGERTP